MDHVTLSIVIGTYNRLPLLQKCLGALEQGVHVDREITVIDGGSTDGTLEYLEQYHGIRLVKDDGLVGQAKSLNRVFMLLDTEYVCWLSDDNIVVDGALDLAVGILKNNHDIGMVALKIKDITGPYINEPYLGGIWEYGIMNCNQGMLPVKLLQKLSGFDEDFRDYGIDIDLTTRVLLAGYKVVYTKQMAIYHYRDHETDSWVKKSDREKRLQSARELYRSRYAMLIRKDRLPVKPAASNSDSTRQRFPVWLVFLFEKLVFHYRMLRNVYNILSSEAAVGRPISTFFRDLYNIHKGRFISRWDLLKNYRNNYYLVQQIPETLSTQIRVLDKSIKEKVK